MSSRPSAPSTLGRAVDALASLSAKFPMHMKARLIEKIIGKLNQMDLFTKLRAILLVEHVRLDGKLYKPALRGATRSDEKGQLVLAPEVIDQAAALYTDWWHNPAP